MNPTEKVRPEDLLMKDGVKIGEKEIQGVSGTYMKFYKWRSFRSGLVRHFRNTQFEDYLKLSRQLFWNSVNTPSDDLNKLGLDLSLPFARKEVMDLLGKISSLQIRSRIVGDSLDALGIKVLQGMYKKWWFKSNGNVEEFWELLYGFVNGTVCSYIGYNNEERQRRYLKNYDAKTGDYSISTKGQKYWNDVTREVVPIEDIYLPKIFERNIQNQGALLWKTQMDEADFHDKFPTDKYPMAKYVFPGLRIAEDSLYFRLLGGTGTTTANKIEVMRSYDWITDEYKLIAGGMVLNKLGTQDKIDWAPMPFDHKMAPFTWGIMSPLDEKLAYGLSTSYQAKDPHKVLNTAYCVTPETKILTRDLQWVRAENLKLGDKLVGFEEQGKENTKKKEGRGSRLQRHFEESHVVATGRLMAPVFKITFEDGTELKSTGNHRWLAHNWAGHEVTWLRTDEMNDVIVKRPNGLFLPKYFDVIEQDKSYESGYLGGLFDGEGSLSLGNSDKKPSRGVQLSFAQQENKAFEKGIELLEKKGFEYSVGKRTNPQNPKDPCHHVFLKGGFSEVMRFLMTTRPERIINEGWGKKKISDMILQKKVLLKVVSVEFIGEQEIITLETSSKTYIAEGFGAHNTMIVERELRAIDPPILSSDIEAPELIFGQHKTIPVNDVNAYKEMKISEPSNQFYNMMNSLQDNMKANTSGGDSAVLNSRQPTSAQEVSQDAKLQQQSASNVVTMYYDIMRQQVILVLKTALQFYPLDKYENSDKGAIRTLMVHDMPMSLGGIGDMEIRIVKEKQSDMNLFLEGIKKSITNGKNTEIVEVPVDWLQDLEFQILKIELDTEENTDLENSSFVDNVITPMITTYVPAGVADINKVMQRHLERLGESVSDYAKEQTQNAPGAEQAQPTVTPGETANPGQTSGNLKQAIVGQRFGMNNVNGKAKAL